MAKLYYLYLNLNSREGGTILMQVDENNFYKQYYFYLYLYICMYLCLYLYFRQRPVSKKRERAHFSCKWARLRFTNSVWRPKSSGHNKANINAHTLTHHSWYCSNDSIFLGQKQVRLCLRFFIQPEKKNRIKV